MKVLTGGILISISLLPLIGCPPPVKSGGNPMPFAQPPGLPNPPGNDQKTRDYFNQRVGFGNSGNQGADVSFRSSTGVRPLRVDPENRAQEVDWFLAARDKFSGGAIVAKIKNLSNATISELGLNGQNDSVYIWVGPIQANYAETGIAFYKFDSSGNGTRVGTKFYAVLRCHDTYSAKPSVNHHVDHDVGNSDICSNTVLGPTAADVRTAIQPRVQLASLGSIPVSAAAYGGLWISCSGGCCDVGGSSFF